MKDILIGHRGEPESWPENSLTGYREILRAGARYLETDVQVTADGVAVLSHDPSLLKITGQDLLVTATPSREVLSLSAGYPERFGEQFSDYRITTLAAFAELLAQWPDARAFVEIKHASIRAFGMDRVIDIILSALSGVQAQCTLISFEYAALQHVREHAPLPIGWVLPAWNDDHRELAHALAPDYLFLNHKRLPPPPEPLWRGPWQWVVYTVNAPADIAPYLERGFSMVETNVIRSLLASMPTND
jgi:glycerophosphoryl diester phosphodiesterase